MSTDMAAVEKTLSQYGISRECACIVGSYCLFLKGLRNNRDIDFAFAPGCWDGLIERHRDRLKVLPSGAICIEDNIQSARNRYEEIGVTDEDLFRSEYSELIDGWRVARLELEFVHKLRRGKPKDRADVKSIEAYALKAADWEWGLVSRLAFSAKSGKAAGRNNRRITQRLLRGLREPRKIVSFLAQSSKRSFRAAFPEAANRLADLKRNRFPVLGTRLPSDITMQVTSYIPSGAVLALHLASGDRGRDELLQTYLTVVEAAGSNAGAPRVAGVEKSAVLNILDRAKNDGFLAKNPVSIGRHGEVVDGIDRLACALYLDADNIPIMVSNRYGSVDRAINGVDARFDEHRVGAVEEELCVKFGVYFVAFLWPPVQKYFDEIETWIGARYRLRSSYDLNPSGSFDALARAVYALDDIDQWKIEVKLNAMRSYPPKVRCLIIDLSKPEFRIKGSVASYLSGSAVKLKRALREEFRDRVPNYIYDIVCHVGDNHTQNRKLWQLIQPYLRTSERLRDHA